MTTQSVQSSAPTGTQLKGSNFALKTDDFIRMMITQLQNQDPLQPAKNEELLAQMSQIGQLESATMLQESLKGLVIQNQIAAAGNLIGKLVEGTDATGQNAIRGTVTSVRVTSDGVSLELDNGFSLPLSNVTTIAAAPASQVLAV
jgi:flagellar basal-body rod modification protein FlgD